MFQPNSTQKSVIPGIFHMERLNGLDVFEMPIAELQKHLAQQSFTSEEYVAFCLERIRRIDPFLEAVMEINPDAIEIAVALDKERRQGIVRSQLHGIPVLVKYNIATKDKMQTTCGSWALLGSIVPRDAFVVSQLREAGAVILGHSSLTEWASTRSTWYSDGYSPRRGQVRNPYDLSRSPCIVGSSGGSAVAVAANMVPLAIGTETDGSIAGPAQINGLVGIKPTPGLTSRKGTIPTSETMDTVGVLGKTVRDAVVGLNALVGADPDDPRTMSKAVLRHGDYASFMANKTVLKGAKFGLPIKRCWEFVSDDQKAVVTELFSHLKALGAEIFEVDYPCAEDRIAPNGKWNWDLGTPSQREFTVIRTEAYNGINEYLSELENTEIKTFLDILNFNYENTGSEGGRAGDHPAFPTGQDIFEQIAEHRGVRDQEYHDALKYIQNQTRENGIDAALLYRTETGDVIELDALILCDRRLVGQQIAAQAGYPTITLPVGLDVDGMPVGITLQQTAWNEAALIKWASAIEDVKLDTMGPRPVPTYRDHLAKNIPIGRKNIKAEFRVS